MGIIKNQEEDLTKAFMSNEDHSWPECREALESFFGSIQPENARLFNPACFDEAALWFRMLINTGLSREPEGTPASIFFACAVAYLLNNAPPEMKSLMDLEARKIFPQIANLKPVGFNDDGTACYRFTDLCQAFGVEKDEALEMLGNLEGTGAITAEEDLHTYMRSALGRTTLRDYIKKGSLPGYKVGGKTLVRKSEFDQWIGKFRIKEHDVDADVGELLSRVRKAKSSKRV